MNHVILGAGKIGSRLYKILQLNGISDSNITIWDTHPDKVKDFEQKSKIIRTPDPSSLTQEFCEESVLYITVYAHDVSADLFNKFKNVKFKDIKYKRAYFSQLFIDECRDLEDKNSEPHDLFTCFTCPSRRSGESESCNIFDKRYGPPQVKNEKSPIVLDTVGLLVTTSCNLTCVGCNHLRDKFEPHHNVSFDEHELISSVKYLSQSVDFIRSLVIVGGESFLHKRLGFIVSECKKISNIGYIQIITNGGILPIDSDVFGELNDRRVIVEISGYGSNISLKNQANRQDLVKKLRDYDVMFRYDEATSWIDFGNFEYRNYSANKFKSVYQNCCFVSNDILNGKLYKCSRSAYGEHTGLIKSSEKDFLDLKLLPSLPHDIRRKKVRDYLNMIPSACQHCDGTNPNLIPAGIQVAVEAK